MKQSVKLGVFLLVTLLLGGAFLAVSAKSTRNLHTTVVRGVPAAPPTLVFNRSLKSSSFSFGEADVAIPPGFVNIDSPLGFTCPGPTTCTVAVEMNGQLGDNFTSSNGFALMGLLDGNFMDGGPYLGELLTDGRFSSGTWFVTNGNVAPGHHTLQTQVYTDDGAELANYEIVYRLYKP